MSTEAVELLYQVDEDNVLQEFVVVLGVGQYINVANTETGELKNMEARNTYRDDPVKAWNRRLTLLELELDHARSLAMRDAKHHAMLLRITAEYSKKEEDLKSARDKLEEHLDRIINVEALLADALKKATHVLNELP